MMTVSIIVEDKTVVKDGVGYCLEDDFPATTDVHALQWDGSSGYIETLDGTNVDISALPDWANSCLTHWQTLNDEYIANQPAEEQTARFHRDVMLRSDVDPIVSNPLRWDALTTEKQSEWLQYRTDLLDVPEQSGFPSDIQWPTKPSE